MQLRNSKIFIVFLRFFAFFLGFEHVMVFLELLEIEKIVGVEEIPEELLKQETHGFATSAIGKVGGSNVQTFNPSYL